MAQTPFIHQWTVSRMFGQIVLRGEVNGVFTVMPIQYVFGYPDDHGEVDYRFYCNDGSDKAVTHKFRAGVPAHDPWNTSEKTP